MLIRGGENVYPREIEEYLFRHPKIESAQIFGVPRRQVRRGDLRLDHSQGGTRARLRMRSSGFCQGQIAHYKIPRFIRFVKEMPMTVTGKPQKFIMRDAMIEELGLEAEKTA